MIWSNLAEHYFVQNFHKNQKCFGEVTTLQGKMTKTLWSAGREMHLEKCNRPELT